MKPLLDILTEYEGAIQENEDEHSEETAARLEIARNALLQVLQEAKQIERYKEALHWMLCRLDVPGLRREGCGRLPDMYETVRDLAYGGNNGTVVHEGKGTIDRGTESAAGRRYGGGCF